MGIIFTPYIGFGLGSSIRQLTYEFNNARMLHIKGPLSKIIETIPLEGAHPDVQPIKPHEYENFVICIPEISKTLDRALYAIHPKPVGRVYPVKPVGEHVKKGDGIAVHTSFIVSPVEGKIAYMGYQNDNGCDWPQGADWPRSREWADPKDPVEISFTTKSKIQPLKGSFVAANYIADSYQHAINLIEKNVFNDPPKRFRTAMLPDWQNEVAQALIILKNAKARIEHLSDPTTNPNVGM
ncbi:MAG: hypothetical protein WBK55_04890 [Alphaproteobacteria bacterium]